MNKYKSSQLDALDDGRLSQIMHGFYEDPYDYQYQYQHCHVS